MVDQASSDVQKGRVCPNCGNPKTDATVRTTRDGDATACTCGYVFDVKEKAPAK